MKIAKLRLVQEPNKSFIVHTENDPFTPWHHHPEYELVLIVGPYLPHVWIMEGDKLDDEAFVIQFDYYFLGDHFFEIPEHISLKKFLLGSERGYKFFGNTKYRIISILNKMMEMMTM